MKSNNSFHQELAWDHVQRRSALYENYQVDDGRNSLTKNCLQVQYWNTKWWKALWNLFQLYALHENNTWWVLNCLTCGVMFTISYWVVTVYGTEYSLRYPAALSKMTPNSFSCHVVGPQGLSSALAGDRTKERTLHSSIKGNEKPYNVLAKSGSGLNLTCWQGSYFVISTRNMKMIGNCL